MGFGKQDNTSFCIMSQEEGETGDGRRETGEGRGEKQSQS